MCTLQQSPWNLPIRVGGFASRCVLQGWRTSRHGSSKKCDRRRCLEAYEIVGAGRIRDRAIRLQPALAARSQSDQRPGQCAYAVTDLLLIERCITEHESLQV